MPFDSTPLALMIVRLTSVQLEASIQARNHIRMQQQAAAAGMQPMQPMYPAAPTMFYNPGQQTSFLPQGGRGMPFPPQQGMMPQGGPGGPGGRGPQGGSFPPNGGRGPMPQGIPQAMYGPPSMGPGGGPGGPGFSPYPNPQALAAAQAQAVAATGRGRGGMPPSGVPGVPQGMPMIGSRGPAPTGRGAPRANAPPPQQHAPRQPIPAPQQVLPPSSIDINQFAARSHQEQKQFLGEALYPKVQRQHPGLAGKITGMLLEMENMELLALFVSPLKLLTCLLNTKLYLQS